MLPLASAPRPAAPPAGVGVGLASLLMDCTRLWMRSFLPFLAMALSSSFLALASSVHRFHHSRKGGGSTRESCSLGSKSKSARVAAACCASFQPKNSPTDSNRLSCASPVILSVSVQLLPTPLTKLARPMRRFCRYSSSCRRGVLPDQLAGMPTRAWLGGGGGAAGSSAAGGRGRSGTARASLTPGTARSGEGGEGAGSDEAGAGSGAGGLVGDGGLLLAAAGSSSSSEESSPNMPSITESSKLAFFTSSTALGAGWLLAATTGGCCSSSSSSSSSNMPPRSASSSSGSAAATTAGCVWA